MSSNVTVNSRRSTVVLILLSGMLILLAGLFVDRAWHLSEKSISGDFSSYWLSSWWMRERPPNLALYYPNETENRPDIRIWTCIRDWKGESLNPWKVWGRKHGFKVPKFYLYPPLFAILFIPITFFPLSTALRVWGLVNAFSLLIAIVLIVLYLRPSFLSTIYWALAVSFFSLISYPVLWTLELGQNSLFLFLILTVFFISLDRKMEILSGIALGFLVMVKLNPVIFIPWLFWRRFYRAAWSAVLTIGILGLWSFHATGFDTLRIYFGQLLPLLATGTHFYENQSLLGFLLRMSPNIELITAPPGIVDPSLKGLYTILVILMMALQWIKIIFNKEVKGESLQKEFCGQVLLLLMISPVTWSHHLVNSLLVFWILLRQILSDKPFDKQSGTVMGVIAISYLLQSLPVMPLNWLETTKHPWIVSYRFYGVFLLWIYLLFKDGILTRIPKLERGILSQRLMSLRLRHTRLALLTFRSLNGTMKS